MVCNLIQRCSTECTEQTLKITHRMQSEMMLGFAQHNGVLALWTGKFLGKMRFFGVVNEVINVEEPLLILNIDTLLMKKSVNQSVICFL